MKTLVSRARPFKCLSPRLPSLVFLTALFVAAPFRAASAQIAPTLGTAQSFAVLAGTPNVTNTGPTVITGDLGIHPGSEVTGFPPGIVIGGTTHAANAVALQAKNDLVAAYDALDAQGCDQTFPNAADLVGLTLGPGVYCSASSLFLSGTLTLDAQFNPNAVWVFKTESTLITASASTVRMTNGGQQCNVFWKVGSSATLGTTTTFIGNILALTSISLNTGANVSGRVLARNGSVTMDSNRVAPTACGVPQAGPIPPTVGKAFNPAIIAPGGASTLTITLSNAGLTDATDASITDTLPAGVFINGAAATTCGGTVDTGISSVTLTGGVIPAGGSCTVTVPVTSANGGIHTNTLGVGALQSSNGPNGAAAFADLNVLVPNSPPTLVKGFNPGTINAGGVSTLTITLSNTNGQAADLNAPLIDTLPGGVFVAATPGVVNSCGGAVTAIPGATKVSLSAVAAIPANGSCSVSVNVTAPGAANYLNVLVAGALQTNRGNNAAPAMATLVVVPVIVQPPGNTPGLSLSKTANSSTYTAVGQVIVYTYVVKNTGNVTLTGPFTVNDDKLGLLSCGGSGDYAPGATVTCTATYTIQASDLGDESSLPQGITADIDTGSWLSFENSTQDTWVSDAGAGVPDGIYRCWCIQDYVPANLNNQPAQLYSTAGAGLPADVAGLAWGKVNYTLNHKIRGAGRSNLEFLQDVQTAIWVLLGEQNPEFGISVWARQMIDAANANATFLPSSGEIVAVLLHSDGISPQIRPGEIQESICEMNSKLKSIVNKATASVTLGSGAVVSGQVQVIVKQVR